MKGGKDFLKYINNGFSQRIGNTRELQSLYEQQKSSRKYTEPTELVDSVNKIIEKLNIEEIDFDQKKYKIFKYKEKIPVKQLFALYAINKISTIANEN